MEYGVDGFKLDAGDPEYYKGTYSFGDYGPMITPNHLHASDLITP